MEQAFASEWIPDGPSHPFQSKHTTRTAAKGMDARHAGVDLLSRLDASRSSSMNFEPHHRPGAIRGVPARRLARPVRVRFH